MKNISVFTTVLISISLFFVFAGNYAAEGSEENQKKFDVENAGTLTGRVILADGTLFTGFVSFFENDSEYGEHQDYGISKRSPKMVGFFNKEDGKFMTQLFPAGSYFMGAVETDKWVGGPPREDQKKYSAVDQDGKYMLFEVKAGETVDIGTVVVREPVAFPDREIQFTITGKVLDAQGKGIPNSVVVAKKDLNDPKGLFISEQTDENGNYQLKIPPGTFFFVARKTLSGAGRPKPGGLMGTLGHTKPVGLGGKSEEPPAYITGKDGDSFKDVNITMFEVPIPDVRRKEVEAQVKAKEIDKSTLPEDLPLMKQKTEDAVPSKHKPE